MWPLGTWVGKTKTNSNGFKSTPLESGSTHH